MSLIDRTILEWAWMSEKGYPDINNENDLRVFESSFGFKVFEGSLTHFDLVKPFPPRHEFLGKYKDRGERFLEKINIGDSFELNSGGTVIIDKEKSTEAIEALQNKNYELFKGIKGIKFFTKDGKELSLTKLKKTKEFGSGGGSGGGAQNTRIQESSMALVCAISLIEGGVQEKDINDKTISSALSRIDVDASKEEMTDFINVQKTWKDTFIGSANALLKTYNNPNFNFHRGSKFVNKIYNAYAAGKKEAEVNMQNDKWNPADIWAVDSSILDIEFPTNLEKLNALLVELFTSEKLIGISLKKATSTPKISVVNLNKDDFNGYTYDEYIMKSTNNSLIINYSGGKIAFRNFQFAANYAGEIAGKTAQHGKIGIGPLNTTLRFNNLSSLPSNKEIKDKFLENDQELLKDYKNLFLKYVEKANDEVFDKVQKNDINYKSSKYLSLKLLDTIETAEQKKQDEFISDIIRYASSMSKVSSVHVKVS